MIDLCTTNKAKAFVIGVQTNGGTRIDIKLRTENLEGFRRYSAFWSQPYCMNFLTIGFQNTICCSERNTDKNKCAEYLTTHRAPQAKIVNGKTAAELADLNQDILKQIPETIFDGSGSRNGPARSTSAINRGTHPSGDVKSSNRSYAKARNWAVVPARQKRVRVRQGNEL